MGKSKGASAGGLKLNYKRTFLIGFAFFGIHVHTSELIHLEHLSVLSDTSLLEEDWSR